MARMPKRQYFEMRYAQAVASGNTRKAEYYKGRLDAMKATEVLDNLSSKATALERAKAKMEGLSEAEKLVEANRFYVAMTAKGVPVGHCVDFISKVIGDDLAIHATQF